MNTTSVRGESPPRLFEGGDEKSSRKELAAEYNDGLVAFDEGERTRQRRDDFLPITTAPTPAPVGHAIQGAGSQ